MIISTSEDEEKKAEQSDTFQSAVKRFLLQSYHEIMRERNISLTFGIVLIVLMTLQLIGYAYDKKTAFPFQDELFSTISDCADIIRIYPAIQSSKNGIGYWAVMFLFLVVILAYGLLMVYVNYSVNVGKYYFDFPLTFLSNLSSLFLWVMACPYVEMFISIFSCDGDYHEADTTLKCWNGLHIFYCFLFFLFLLVFIFLGCLIAIFFNESRHDSTDAFARLDTGLELLLFLYRVGVAIVTHFCANSSYHWVLIIIHLCGSLTFAFLYIRHLPFYHAKVSIVFGICIFSYLWVSINLLLLKLLENVHYTGQSLVIIIGILIIIPVVNNLRDKFIYNILFDYRYDKIKEEHDLDLYLNKILELLHDQAQKEVDELVLVGFVNHHKSECTNPACPLSSKEELYLPRTGETLIQKQNYKDPVLVLHMILSIYEVYSKTSNFNAMLHINFSYFLFKHIGNIHAAIVQLDVAEKLDISLQQLFTVYRSRKFIENHLVKKYKKQNEEEVDQRSFQNHDVTLVITFENLYSKLLKSIEKSANEHIEFWSHLDSLLPDLNILHKLGLNITNYNRETEDIWNHLIKINNNHRKALHNYGLYLRDIRNDEEAGGDLLDKSKALKTSASIDENLNDFNSMFADDTAIIVISAGNKENQGKITKTNAGITNLFKYNPLEVTGQDINILMPPIIAAKHHMLMERYFFTGKEKVVNNERELYAMPRTGSVICISSIVKPVPSLKDDIQYIGLIRQRNRDDDFIVANSYGKIDSISESLSGKLRLHNTFFKENEVYVQFLCPDLMNLEKKADGQLCTLLDLLSGFVELTFMLPRDFHNIIQGFSKNINLNRLATETEDEKDSIKNEANYVLPFEGNTKDKQKVPEAVKKISQLLFGGGYEKDLGRTKNIIREAINYDTVEIKEKWMVEVKQVQFGEGMLKLKVFRILTNKVNDDNTSEKFYGVKRAPSRTRTRPEQLEHLKSVGLDPEEHTSSSHIRTPDDVRREANLLNIEEEEKGAEVLSKIEEDKESKVQEPPTEKIGEISLTSITEPKLLTSTNRDPSGVPNPESAVNIVNPTDPNISLCANPNDVSLALNQSNLEAAPLVQATFPSGMESKYPYREQYLTKIQMAGDDQEAVIRNLMKGKNDFHMVVEKDEKVETEEGKQDKLPETKKPDVSPDDDIGSVASRTKSLMKHIRALRNAVYEMYCPRSVQQLKYVARFVFLVLLVITLVYFFIAKVLYADLQDNVENLYYSKNRLSFSTAMGAYTRSLVLINPSARTENISLIDMSNRTDTDYYKDGCSGNQISGYTSMNYYEWCKYCLEYSSKQSKIAQNGLSTSSFDLDSKNLEQVNPSRITVNYKKEDQIAGEFELDCWSAIMGLVIHGLKVKDMGKTEVLTNDSSVYYILQNSFNNILDKIYGATDTITKESDSTATSNRNILLILLCVASTAIAISIFLIFRVVIVVSHNKEDILKLFIDIPPKNIKEQLNTCRRYFTIFRDSDKVDIGERDIDIEEDEEEKKETAEEEENEEDEKKAEETAQLMEDEDEDGAHRKGRARHNKKKKYKNYSTQLLTLIFQFGFFICLLEGYFLLSYFKSASFLSTAIDIIKEISSLSMRTFSNGFLFRTMQEYIGTNGTGQVQNVASATYISTKISSSVEEQEEFLRLHSENMGINKEEYNDMFNKIVYSNLCEVLFTSTSTISECNSFSVLGKGLHSANIAFWDTIRSTVDDYQKLTNSAKTLAYIQSVFSSSKIKSIERMRNRYFTLAYQKLLSLLDENLQSKFDFEYQLILILFIVYLILLFLLYFFIWSFFVESTRNSLWVTKCMLGIIPVKTIENVRNIKEFLINSSKGLMLSLGSDQFFSQCRGAQIPFYF